MSKYTPLWEHLQGDPAASCRLTFAQIGEIAGVPLDHSFLRYKRELTAYGWRVEKISMKEETVLFVREGAGA